MPVFDLVDRLAEAWEARENTTNKAIQQTFKTHNWTKKISAYFGDILAYFVNVFVNLKPIFGNAVSGWTQNTQ